MNEKKTAKYLKYAIGEIVLVVIGILIALQINNWNEARKQKETTNTIYKIVKQDLENDLVKIELFLTNYEDKWKPAFEAVLRTKLTKEDWIQNPTYLYVLGGFEDFAINQRGFELLKSQVKSSIDVEKNLAAKINEFYNEHNVELNIAVDELSDDFRDNRKHFKNYDWYSDSFLNRRLNDDSLDFLVNNPQAINRITSFYLIFDVYIKELTIFKTKALDLITQIDDHLLNNSN